MNVSEKIQNWSVLKTLIIFNLIGLATLIFFFIIIGLILKSGGLAITISGIITFIFLTYGWKYCGQKIREKNPVEKKPKLNKAGKIILITGSLLGLITLFGVIPVTDKVCAFTAHAECYWGWGLVFIGFFLFVAIPIILIGMLLWLSSNFGIKNTLKIILIAIGSIIFQILALMGLVKLSWLIFKSIKNRTQIFKNQFRQKLI